MKKEKFTPETRIRISKSYYEKLRAEYHKPGEPMRFSRRHHGQILVEWEDGTFDVVFPQASLKLEFKSHFFKETWTDGVYLIMKREDFEVIK